MSQVSTFANDLPRYRQTITRKISDLQRVSKGGALEKVEDDRQGRDEADRQGKPGRREAGAGGRLVSRTRSGSFRTWPSP